MEPSRNVFFRPVRIAGFLHRHPPHIFQITFMHAFPPSRSKLEDIFQVPDENELLAGLYLYIFRLNAHTLRRVEAWLQEVIPCDLDPSRTISLPIRASDKCIDEFRVASSFEVKILLVDNCVFAAKGLLI